MSILKNKNILLAITGGIAAYKCPELCRLLTKNDANVQVLLSNSARHFVSSLVLSNLSKRNIPLSGSDTWLSMDHIELARWPDVIVVSPATANTIAKIAHGLADDIISCVILASERPVICCPSMNAVMYGSPATQHNLSILKSRSISICGPACGDQACGEYGFGRMSEPNDIVSHIETVLNEIQNKNNLTKINKSRFKDKNIVITCGPTREYLDPIRYISNKSSGKMGYALANAALQLGANVILISGDCTAAMPKSFVDQKNNLSIRQVVSAIDMHNEVMNAIKHCDVFIGCAAVVDFRPIEYHQEKIKKTKDASLMTVEFEKNPDIIAEVAKFKKSSDRLSMVVGFSADTNNFESNARQKLIDKGIDLICANDCSIQSKYGFDSDYNQLLLIDHHDQTNISGSKEDVAFQLFNIISEKYKE